MLNSCISTYLSSCEGLGFPGKEVAVNMCAGVPLRIQAASVVCQRTLSAVTHIPVSRSGSGAGHANQDEVKKDVCGCHLP